MSPNATATPLFSPFEHKSLRLRNRFCMAPMTREMSPGGTPTDEVVAYYERRARHGVGLLITEGTTIDHAVATGFPDAPRFHGEAPLAMWKQVADAVHEAGGAIIPQLWHVGMARRPGTPVRYASYWSSRPSAPERSRLTWPRTWAPRRSYV